MSLLLGVVGLAWAQVATSFEITRDKLPEWLSDRSVNELHNAYLNLDYNRDGFVSFRELKLGVVSMLDHEIFSKQFEQDNHEEISMRDEYLSLDSSKEQFQAWFEYKPESFSCAPSLDPVDFVDCMVLSARHLSNDVNHGMTDNSIVLFETALSMYLGHDCQDISPMDGTSCDELIHKNTISACSDSENYCTLSCHQCTVESKMFGENIRGKNNKWKENIATNGYKIDQLKRFSNLNLNSQENEISKLPNAMRRLMEENENKKVFHNLGPKKSVSNVDASTTSSCKFSKKDLHTNSNRFWFVSDSHLEPWYDVSGAGEVSRFDDAECTVANMFECHDTALSAETVDGLIKPVECSLNGESDPPISMYSTALNAMMHRASRLENSVLFFVGDLQAHDYTEGVSSPLEETMVALQKRMLSMTYPFFTTDQIFITPGNNDGPHNSLFVMGSGEVETSASETWANVLISEGIVNNYLKRKYTIEETAVNEWSQTDIFLNIGYYMKALPEHGEEMRNTYVIVLNTNLGSSNYLQNKILEMDLEWISETMNGKAIILAHHPNVITSMIAEKYLNGGFISGIFSGHIHTFVESDENGFTVLPALTQIQDMTGFASADLDAKTGKLNLDDSNLLVYSGNVGESANYACWTQYQAS